MKKLLSIGLLTVCALAISEHAAQAWVNSRFSVGLNWHLQSANNSTLWGLWRNGQIPGPESFGPPPGPGFPPPPGPQPFPWTGAQNGMPPGAAPNGAYTQSMPNGYQQSYQPMSATGDMYAPMQGINQVQQYYYPNTSYYGNNPYQPVSYQPQGYSYYQPNYYYPAYNNAAPYYWYGSR